MPVCRSAGHFAVLNRTERSERPNERTRSAIEDAEARDQSKLKQTQTAHDVEMDRLSDEESTFSAKQQARLAKKFERCRQAAARISTLEDENQRLLIEIFQDPRPQPNNPTAAGPNTDNTEEVILLSNLPWLTQHRPAEENAQKDAVRKAILFLIQGKNEVFRVPQGPPCHLDAPSVDEFYVSWLEPLTAKSKWNTQALRVITDFVMTTYSSLFAPHERPVAYKCALRHLRSMAGRLNSYLSAEAKEQEKHRLRVNARKRSLYSRRVNVILTFPDKLGHHLPLYRTLGPANMTSDEEDETLTGRNRQKTFVIKRRECFSDSLSLLNKKLDIIHGIHVEPIHTRGVRPCPRVDGNAASSNGRIPIGLPRNCYTARWWKTLTTEERQMASIDPQPHDFGVPRELLHSA